MKYYVTASTCRSASAGEKAEIKLQNVEIFTGHMTAIVEADNGLEALTIGEGLIKGNLRPGYKATDFGYISVDTAEELGDTEIHLSYARATWLRYYRLRRGMTLDQLADASGVNVRQIDQVERGEVDPGNVTTQIMLALADALGVEVQELLK